MTHRKRDNYVSVIDAEEFFDTGDTEEFCACGQKKIWRNAGRWNAFLACSSFPKCAWTSYKK